MYEVIAMVLGAFILGFFIGGVARRKTYDNAYFKGAEHMAKAYEQSISEGVKAGTFVLNKEAIVQQQDDTTSLSSQQQTVGFDLSSNKEKN